jgi:hypothetical protein
MPIARVVLLIAAIPTASFVHLTTASWIGVPPSYDQALAQQRFVGRLVYERRQGAPPVFGEFAGLTERTMSKP